MPPSADLLVNGFLFFPIVDRQAEGRFGDEVLAGNRFICPTDPVVFEFVVAADHPNLTLVLHPDLRAAQNVARRMEAEPNTVLNDLRPKFDGLYPRLGNAVLYGWCCLPTAEIVLVAASRMVGVAVGDQGFLDRPPRIDVHAGLRTINSLIIENQ